MESTSLRHMLTWNPHLDLVRPEIDIFELARCVKWVFCPVQSEINIFAVMRYREINILTYLGLKMTFLSLRAAWNQHFAFAKWNQHPCHHAFGLVRPEIAIFELMRCVKQTFCSFLKWNQHLCRHTLTWNPHFNLARPELTFLSLCAMWIEQFSHF